MRKDNQKEMKNIFAYFKDDVSEKNCYLVIKLIKIIEHKQYN